MEITSYLLGKKAGGGGDTPTGTIQITQNGITNVSSYASADVNVQPNLQSKEVSITSNGSSTISPDSSYDGLSSVSLTTNVQPNLETKSITITENTTTTVTPTSGKDGMSSVEITTNVSGGGGTDWSAIGYSSEPSIISDGYDYAVQVKNNWDTTATSYYEKFKSDENLIYMPMVEINSSATSMYSMFAACTYLQTVPQLNTSNITSMRNMFSSCKSLQTIPQLDTSNVTTMQYMFTDCSILQTIPQLNTSNVTNMTEMFTNCSKLESIPLLDFSKANNVYNMLSNVNLLKNVGGFKDIGKAYSTTASANNYLYTLVVTSSKLTHDSLMNIINNLYDIGTAGVQSQRLQIGTTNKNKLTAEEIAIATNKGWEVV